MSKFSASRGARAFRAFIAETVTAPGRKIQNKKAYAVITGVELTRGENRGALGGSFSL